MMKNSIISMQCLAKKDCLLSHCNKKLQIITAVLLNEPCNDVTADLILSHVADKHLLSSASNSKDETRKDVNANSFLIKSQKE